MATAGARPRVRSASMAKSTIMMAFFFTMPISNTMPINATTDKSRPQTSNANKAPIPADGRVEIMVIGWIQLSYNTPSTM